MDERRIVCFGDSNTWGYNPESGSRYSDDIRWTKLLEKKLGGDYRIIEEGQNGRTIANPDPWEWGTKCGMDQILPILESHMPMEALVIMLGSNDLKSKFGLPAPDIAGSLQNMLKSVRGHLRYYLNNPDLKILIIAPPALGENFASSPFAEFFDADSVVQKSKDISKWFELVAGQFGCEFLDATSQVTAGDVDSLHLSPEGHAKLAELVYQKLKSML
ncbi:MAG: GDSL-type esterase/lipase family protein [Lachnospiraceae bacterium]|nr:GDSL-type esterase/lipase family protein [Lachnospiraceae bacterium]